MPNQAQGVDEAVNPLLLAGDLERDGLSAHGNHACAENLGRLGQLAEFSARNLTFSSAISRSRNSCRERSSISSTSRSFST